MKLLLVSNMYPSKKYPHYGVFVRNTEQVLRQLSGLRLDRTVLYKRDSKAAKLLGYLWFYVRIVVQGVLGGYDVIYAHFISHVSLPLRVVKALNPRVRLVLNAHGNDVAADTPADERFVEMSCKLIPLADKLIVPSNYFAGVLEALGARRESLLVYPSGGIDTATFYPRPREQMREKYDLDPHKKYVGYISRLETDKGWDTFLQMAAQLPEDVRFIVVGDGAQRAGFEEMARSLELDHRLIRYPLLAQQQIAELFSALDVFCFPTRRKSESLGLVGLEAMACGCTVVASDCFGPSSYMEDGVNGFTFDATSPQALAQRVTHALAAPRQTLEAGMAQTVESYSRQTVDKILLDCFREF